MKREPRTQALLWDPSDDKSSCGVGFITRKDGVQSHEVIVKASEALCSVPHRGGMSAEGVGDGGGVSMDLSQAFFRKITGVEDLSSAGSASATSSSPPGRKLAPST